MKKVLHIILISLFSLTVFSCSSSEDSKTASTDNSTSSSGGSGSDNSSTTTDTTAPTVTSVSTTADNQSSVSITDNITVTFSEAMDTTYVTTSTSDTNCAGTIRVSSDNFTSCVKMSSEPVSSNSNKTFTLDPYDNLTVSTTYKTRVTTGVKDTAGNTLSTQYETSSGFTTSSSSSSSSSASITAITAGSEHNCAILDNVSVKCWGYNGAGQLGIEHNYNMGKFGSMALLPSINLGTGRTATAISAGKEHTCALLDNASVKCWGLNTYGQLGIDDNTTMGDGSGEMTALPSINLGTGRTATAIAAGGYHSCALLDNASVKCWGNNRNGQLGIDNTTHMGKTSGSMAALPSINLGTGRTATAIAAGEYHSCALLDNASVKCWGYNSVGQLGTDNNTDMGDGSGEMAVLPSINLGTGRTATAIAAGGYHSCALLDNASVKCWGLNNFGQLGIDNSTNEPSLMSGGEVAVLPVVKLGTGRTSTAIAGGFYHTCALLDNASVKCWGLNNRGQLGIDNNTNMGNTSGSMAQLTGINLGTGRTATAISAGNEHSCALLDNASVKCWGYNGAGQLGIEGNDMGDNTGEMAVLPSIDFSEVIQEE